MPTKSSGSHKKSSTGRVTAGVAAGMVPALIAGINMMTAPSTPATVPSIPPPVARMFTPGCNLPFAGALNSPSDDHCGIQGGSSDPAKQAESQAKNDFCAATQSPLVLTHQVLVDMQTKATAMNLRKSLPDRSPLAEMGEGKYVSYVAFVKDAHYSDVGAGEAVNCNIPGNSTNDIHIVLVEKVDENDECTSTTAEMSPHFRPAGWTPEAINAAKGHPVRIRGHLFYDGSHTPCTATSRPNPKRASLWEIHPVYSFDVCDSTDLAKCKESDSAVWVPLEQTVSSEQQ